MSEGGSEPVDFIYEEFYVTYFGVPDRLFQISAGTAFLQRENRVPGGKRKSAGANKFPRKRNPIPVAREIRYPAPVIDPRAMRLLVSADFRRRPGARSRYYSASPVITKLTLYTNFRCGARSCTRLTPCDVSVSAPNFGIASLPRAIVGLWYSPSLSLLSSTLVLYLSFLPLHSLYLLSLSVPVYGNTNGLSEFGSAFKELEEHYPLRDTGRGIRVSPYTVTRKLMRRPTDKFLTTLHLGAHRAGSGVRQTVLHVQQFVGFLAAGTVPGMTLAARFTQGSTIGVRSREKRRWIESSARRSHSPRSVSNGSSAKSIQIL